MHEIEFPTHLSNAIKERLLSHDFNEWTEHISTARRCRNPVRLSGGATKFDVATGAAMSTTNSQSMPDNVLYVRCGNRRASVCPPCSHEYKGDMWHMISAGVAGGDKGVPESVSAHPMVFATLTAPSFGPVHTASKPNSRRRCNPRPAGQKCSHGLPTGCTRRHGIDESRVGEPICRDCYDYDSHIIWQWWAPELWRRFTIALRRQLAARCAMSECEARKHFRLQFAKVAEFQKRGAIHFHALIRLDGAPFGDEGFQAPSVGISASLLADSVREAATTVSFDAPPTLTGFESRILKFGTQIDAQPVYPAGKSGDVSPKMVAAYLAKYATKSVDDLDSSDDTVRHSMHLSHLRWTGETLGRLSDDDRYKLLPKWADMLGFRGHFATKSRNFSTTMGALRQARREYLGFDGESLATPETGETTLVVGHWRFLGMGWLNQADAALATAADTAISLASRPRPSP